MRKVWIDLAGDSSRAPSTTVPTKQAPRPLPMALGDLERRQHTVLVEQPGHQTLKRNSMTSPSATS